MDPLEGSTLDLIYRRRVRTFYQGYTMIFMAVGIFVALPLVKVDVVSTSGGMIRPHAEPAVMVAPISGMVDSTVLKEQLEVLAGDTVVWIRRDLPETRIREYRELIRQNREAIKDITAILEGRIPEITTRYLQSHRKHQVASSQMQIRNDFLRGEFHAAEKLYGQEVIPACDYEQSRSEYMIACARLEDHRESYRSLLEDERYRLELENRSYQGEIASIRASLHGYYVVAPASGILRQCKGIGFGSVLQQGTKLGTISPVGPLVAECYVETMDIPVIKRGMPVKIRFDGKTHQAGSTLETEVSQIDPDAVVMNGKPVYRIRCLLENPHITSAEGTLEPVILGMTFSASMFLYRASLASLLLEKLNRWTDP